MKSELWTLKGEVTANFILISEEHVHSSAPPHPSVQRFVIDPEFNDRNEQTGKFNLEIDFTINTEQKKSPTNVVADLARDILNRYIDFLVFLSGFPVHLVKPPSLIYHYPGTNKFRTISFPTQQATLAHPPVPLVTTPLFSAMIDHKKGRILAWFRKGLQEKDVVNGVQALNVSLEIMSNQFTCEKKLTRTCQNCGHVNVLDPGARQKVEHLLVNEIGFTSKQFQSIWETKTRLSHGGRELSATERRELSKVRQDLVIAIIKGMKKLLNLGSSELPKEVLPEWPFIDPMLDIDYTVPDVS